jgi:hypothetical protein
MRPMYLPTASESNEENILNTPEVIPDISCKYIPKTEYKSSRTTANLTPVLAVGTVLFAGVHPPITYYPNTPPWQRPGGFSFP